MRDGIIKQTLRPSVYWIRRHRRKIWEKMKFYWDFLSNRWIYANPVCIEDGEDIFEDVDRWSDLALKVKLMRQNLDPESLALFNERLMCCRRFPVTDMQRGFLYKPSFFISKEDKEGAKKWRRMQREIQKKYKLDRVLPEVFLYEHGLKLLPPKALEYIRDRDFIDAGAFIGDSALVLSKYGPRRLYCCEVSAKNIQQMRKTFSNNGIGENIEIVQTAIGDHCGTISFHDVGGGSNSAHVEGESSSPLITIDQLAENHHMKVGVIKADIEGMGLDLVKGAVNTLKRDRPVLTLAIYHNMEEFFDVKPFIESLNLNYTFKLRRLHPRDDAFFSNSEETLIAYPAELDTDNHA